MRRLKIWSLSLNNKKQYLANEAERLFMYEYCTVNEIATKLHINRKTVLAWKEQEDWDKKRRDYLKSKQAFHEEMYEFARKLLKSIKDDFESGQKVDTGRLYAFNKIIPMFTKVKDYEDIVSIKDKPKKQKGLTPEIVAEIEEQILGIKQPDADQE